MSFLELSENEITRNFVYTGIFLVAMFLLRHIIVRAILHSRMSPIEAKRNWIVQTRNFSFFIMILCLAAIWANEIRSFALSMVAIAAALAIATKEYLACIMGGLYRTVSRPYRIGDRIEIHGQRGDVINIDLVATTLLEIGPGHRGHQITGRTITVPNSALLTSPILNESGSGEYNMHTFTISDSREVNALKIRHVILEASNEICAPYLQQAKAVLESLGKAEGIEPPTADPRVTVHFPTRDQIDFIVRVPVPTSRPGRIELDIVNRYLELCECQK